MKQTEIVRYAGSIVGLGEDFCTVRFKDFLGDCELPKKYFECKIGYGRPFHAIVLEDEKGERTMRCIHRVVELTPERKKRIEKTKELLKDI